MYIYKFRFIFFAPNPFLNGVLANVENFYRPTDRGTQLDIEALYRSFKRFNAVFNATQLVEMPVLL